MVGGLAERLHLDAFEIAHAELEERGGVVQFKVRLEFRGLGGLALAIELLDRQHVERDRVLAEA